MEVCEHGVWYYKMLDFKWHQRSKHDAEGLRDRIFTYFWCTEFGYILQISFIYCILPFSSDLVLLQLFQLFHGPSKPWFGLEVKWSTVPGDSIGVWKPWHYLYIFHIPIVTYSDIVSTMMYYGYNPVDYLTVIQNPTSSLTQSWDRPVSLERCRTVTGANHWERVCCSVLRQSRPSTFVRIWLRKQTQHLRHSACFTLAA